MTTDAVTPATMTPDKVENTAENTGEKTVENKGQSPALNIILTVLGIIMIIWSVCFYLNSTQKPVTNEYKFALGHSMELNQNGISQITRSQTGTFWRSKEIIFPNGYVEGVHRILPNLSARIQLAGDRPVKIIPSGGLFPYYRSQSFNGEIEEYVRKGGSLICLGQPLGKMYSSLPGSPTGIGWAESGLTLKKAVNSVGVNMKHPVFSSLSASSFLVDTLGYFTQVPSNGNPQVLLVNKETCQPVMIAYRYGDGFVIASTLIMKSNYDPGPEDLNMWKDILSWAYAGGIDMVQYPPYDVIGAGYVFCSIETSCDISYYELYQPGGIMDSNSTADPDEPHGIWRMSAVNARNPEHSIVKWFAVGNSPTPLTPTDITCDISYPGNNLVTGSKIKVQVHLWNRTREDTEITWKGPQGKRTVKVNAGQYKTATDELSLENPGPLKVNYEFYNVTGKKLRTIKHQINVGRPDEVFATLSGPQSTKGGKTIAIDLNTIGVNPGGYEANCQIHLTRNGKVYWQEQRTIKLNGAYSTKESFKVELPQSENGTFIIEATITHKKEKITRTWMELTVK